MRDRWYYAVPEGQVGPISLQELKETLPNLPNAKDVYIWHDSLPDWIRAGDLSEIVGKMRFSPADETDFDDVPEHRDVTATVDDDAATWDRQEPDLTTLEDFHPDPSLAIGHPDSSLAIGHPDPGLAIGAAERIADPGPALAARGGDVRRTDPTTLVWGLFLVLVGIGAIYLALNGLLDWLTAMLGPKGRIVTLAPGGLIITIGLVMFWRSRRKVPL
jgi:hypothetical protein